jgi:non-heme chloroperoxidase
VHEDAAVPEINSRDQPRAHPNSGCAECVVDLQRDRREALDPSDESFNLAQRLVHVRSVPEAPVARKNATRSCGTNLRSTVRMRALTVRDTRQPKGAGMPRIHVGTENNAPIAIHYEDHGTGQPVVLIHGYPLDGNSWEHQEPELLAAGYRVISYDRRGFGRSSQPTIGYDYDTFAGDLNALLEHLDLHDVILVGFSMGTGEVTRYLGRYGSERVRKAALLGAIPPFLLKRDDNPEGVDGQVFEDMKAGIVKDRYTHFKNFLDNFYNVDVLAPERISEQAWQASFQVAAGASPHATYVCVDTWLTDFRDDLPKIDVPTLVVHGTDDRILPISATADRLPGLIADLRLVRVEGGPHNIGWTHTEEVNRAVLEFLAEPDAVSSVEIPAAAGA